MTKRTDVHAPASADFDPELYTCYGVFDNNPDETTMAGSFERRGKLEAINRLVDRGYKFGHGGSTQCGHCGARIRYAALMVRDDVKEFIFVGETCLDGRFEMTKDEFTRLRKTAALNVAATRERAAAEDQVIRYPELADLAAEFKDGYGFLAEIAAKVGVKILTDRQIEAFIRAGRQAQERQAQRQAEAAEVRKPVPVTDEKVKVIGHIVSFKTVDGFGYNTYVTKVLIKTLEGYKLFGTLPKAFEDASVGDRITFDAFVTPSDRDEYFGFYALRKTNRK